MIGERGRNVRSSGCPSAGSFRSTTITTTLATAGDTGYLDTEIIYSPFDTDWAAFHDILLAAFGEAGLERLPESEMRETVPFVFDVEFDDDDDDNDAEAEFDDEGHLAPRTWLNAFSEGPRSFCWQKDRMLRRFSDSLSKLSADNFRLR